MLVVLWVLPVDIDTIQAEVFQQLDTASGKGATARLCGCWGGEIAGVSPAANGKEQLQISISLLQQVELLDAAVDVVAGVIPRISLVVLFYVAPTVCQVDFACLGTDVGEGVENVRELLDWKILGIVFPSIDGLMYLNQSKLSIEAFVLPSSRSMRLYGNHRGRP